MPRPAEIDVSTLRDFRSAVLKQAKIELRMNRSLIEMLKGNTPLEAIADFREQWVDPLEELIKQIETINGN